MLRAPELTPEPLLVVCLCAQWCQVCEQYRHTFTQVHQQVKAEHPHCRFLWFDIEDNADVLDPLDVENFPTLFLAAGRVPVFFGAITPQPQTLERLVRSALQDPVARGLPDPAVTALAARLHAWSADQGKALA